MKEKTFTPEPMQLIRPVLPGDKITLTFQKQGFVYFQPIKIDESWKETEQAK